MNLKKIAVMMAGAIVGNMLAERFVLTTSGDDGSPGFVPITDGLGMDEFVRAGVIVASSMLIDKGLRKVGA